jgi:hypothetical protein
MAGTSNDTALDRRRRVEALHLHGATAAAIARALQVDRQTVQRDLDLLARQRARGTDLAAERYRLLAAAKLVEQEAWDLFAGLPPADANGRLGALSKVLAGQAQAIRLVGDLAAGDVEARLAALEDALAGDPAPQQPPSSRSARRTGARSLEP